jgi:hypothetical protein
MKLLRPASVDDDQTHPGPYDPPDEGGLWFLADPDDANEDIAGAAGFLDPSKRPNRPSLVDAAGWRAAEGALARDLADMSFDFGRLVERITAFGPGAVARLALTEAASISWWNGDRVTSDRLALWLSYRIGAADEAGEGLIRSAWVARRLMGAGSSGGIARMLTATLGEEGRADAGLIADASAEMAAIDDLSPVVQACALFHLWKSLDERPGHLRGIEAAVIAARAAVGQGALPFLPLTLTGLGALTTSGPADARLAAWVSGAHRAVLSALMTLDRLSRWRTKAEEATADLSGRTPSQLITALIHHPMLTAAQGQTDTASSRAAVQRNLDVLAKRGLIREVTGQGRFRVWASVG